MHKILCFLLHVACLNISDNIKITTVFDVENTWTKSFNVNAEIVSNEDVIELLNEKLYFCVRTKETSAIDKQIKTVNLYAENLGLFISDSLRLIDYGYLK